MDIRWVSGGFESDLDLLWRDQRLVKMEARKEGSDRDGQRWRFFQIRGGTQNQKEMAEFLFSFPHGKNFSPTPEPNDVVASF